MCLGRYASQNGGLRRGRQTRAMRGIKDYLSARDAGGFEQLLKWHTFSTVEGIGGVAALEFDEHPHPLEAS